MLANEFLAFEHSPLFFVDIIIHCSLLRTCRVRVEEKEEFLVYTVLWTLTCHPYLESATALSDYIVKNSTRSQQCSMDDSNSTMDWCSESASDSKHTPSPSLLGNGR